MATARLKWLWSFHPACYGNRCDVGVTGQKRPLWEKCAWGNLGSKFKFPQTRSINMSCAQLWMWWESAAGSPPRLHPTPRWTTLLGNRWPPALRLPPSLSWAMSSAPPSSEAPCPPSACAVYVVHQYQQTACVQWDLAITGQAHSIHGFLAAAENQKSNNWQLRDRCATCMSC